MKSELRAYDFSGYCDTYSRMSRFSIETKDECLTKMTLNSMSHVVEDFFKNRDKYREQAKAMVDDPNLMKDLHEIHPITVKNRK